MFSPVELFNRGQSESSAGIGPFIIVGFQPLLLESGYQSLLVVGYLPLIVVHLAFSDASYND